jgi:signal transduction histidine kinase/CheY-like chemotaxis protein/PAS domain-containing protein
MKKWLACTVALLLLAALYAVSRVNFLLFHSIAELFSVIIAGGIFMVAWNARHHFENRYLLFIGIAYLFVGMLDVVHTFTYKGMNVLPGYDANVPTQLWIAARYLESLTLLIAPVTFYRRTKAGFYLFGYGAVTLLLLVAILHWRIFPDCFLENAGGLTPFKKISEYLISGILLASGILMIFYRQRFDRKVLSWVLLSIITTIFSELAFTTYAGVTDFSNVIGHCLKIVSFVLIYKAIIETGLAKPFDLLFRDLMQSKERYQALFSHMINGFAYHRVVVDNTGNPLDHEFIEVNEAFNKLTGLTDVVGKRVTDVLPGIREDSVDWLGTYGRLADQGQPIRLETYSENLGRWYSIVAYSPSKGEFATIFEDISDRKQSEAALRKREERFKLLSDTASRLLATEDPGSIVNELCRAVMEHLDCQAFFNFMVDDSTNRLRLNAYAGISEQEASTIIGLDYGVAVCGCVARDRQRVIAEDILDSADLNTERVRSYGIQAYCCHPLMVQDRLIGTLSFGTRTRPRFSSEEVALMQTVAHQVALVMQRVQTRQALREANETLEEKVRERTTALARMVDTLQQEVVQRQQAEAELKRVNEQLSTRAAQLRALAGELTMAEQRERMRLSRLLHDGLQQHLAAAKIQLACAAEQLDNATHKQALDAILSILSQSIQMSRSLSAELSPPVLYHGGLDQGLEWLAGWIQDQYNFRVDLCIDDVAVLSMDLKIILFESIRELLFNAIKHAGVAFATVRLWLAAEEGLRVSVTDEGVGFDPGGLKPAGDFGGGLGLFGIHERIGLIGGHLQIESTPGEGSCFTLTIPHDQASTAACPVHPQSAISGKGKADSTVHGTKKRIRVLVADDHTLFRDGIVRLLNRDPDIDVVDQARDGREAIALARKWVPDVILMDISMPVLNGLEATKVIHSEFPAIRIIGLSMHASDDGSQAMRAAGAIGYKTKDSTAAELAAAIRDSIRVAASAPVDEPRGERTTLEN